MQSQGIENVFDVGARALSAQLVRMNATASNLANAGTVAGSKEEAYQPLRPVFETQYADMLKRGPLATTHVSSIVALNREPERLHQPENPAADEEGYVWAAAVNTEEEMVDMLEASRQYQNTLEAMSTLRALMSRTLGMGS